jgi:hypothetical protein
MKKDGGRMTRTESRDTPVGMLSLLQRLLSAAEVAAIVADYSRVAEAGGNEEAEIYREEGVSFNPRLARVLSILIKDLTVRDAIQLRAALYAAQVSSMGNRWADIPKVLLPLVVPDAKGTFDDARGYTIQAVLALDSVRHLHQSSRAVSEKEQVLKAAESLLIVPSSTGIPDVLANKLQHACAQQRRLLALE